jgi:uncharacterized membrane protein HdeD (DUF308 family)
VIKYFSNRVIIALFVVENENNKKISVTMEFLKYLGVIILLIGVVILAIPTIQGTVSNALLGTGLVVMLVGYIAHIVINKRIQ